MANDLVSKNDIVPAAGGSRMDEIDAVMLSDIVRYRREAMDAERLQLLKDERGEIVPTEPLPAKESQKQLSATEAGRSLIKEWTSRGRTFEVSLAAAQREAGKFVRSLGDDRAQRAFMERFDRSMPELLRFSIYEMLLSCGDNAHVKPADEEGVEHFCEDTAGAALVAKWGREAPVKIARIWKRSEYLKMLTGDDISPLLAWYETLTDKEATSVLEYAAR